MRKKKDILFLCQFFYPEYVSSATLPYDTALAIKDAGYSVDALCGYPQEYSRKSAVPLRESINGIDIHRVRYIQMDRKSFIGRLVNYFSLTFMMFLHLFEIAQYKAVIVYSNPPVLPLVAFWAKLLFRTKLIFVAYDIYPEIAIKTGTLNDGNTITWLMNHINKCVYRHADCVVALSNEMKEYIVNNRPIHEAAVVVIPNWYADQGILRQDQATNSFAKVTKGRFVVSYFGNMGIVQDMETILGAIRKLKADKTVCFLFAGHGNKMKQMKATLAEEKIDNVYFYDFLQGKDFLDALAISDCALISLVEGVVGLCVPSKTYSYMMQGIPLLAIMDQCDIVHDIENGAGAWVRNGDIQSLVQTILSMQADYDMHARMRVKCREIYLEKYTTEKCTSQYVSLLQHLL